MDSGVLLITLFFVFALAFLALVGSITVVAILFGQPKVARYIFKVLLRFFDMMDGLFRKF